MTYKPSTGQSIDAIYAWVATEPDGGEGICGATIDSRGMPLVGADMDRIKSLRSYAEKVRRLTGYPVRLVRYGSREDLEILPVNESSPVHRENPGECALDPYWYAREHDGSGWSVRGPDGFVIKRMAGIDKSVAYIIARLLSGRYDEARIMLVDFAHLMRERERREL